VLAKKFSVHKLLGCEIGNSAPSLFYRHGLQVRQDSGHQFFFLQETSHRYSVAACFTGRRLSTGVEFR
jgi:hypothetical protein